MKKTQVSYEDVEKKKTTIDVDEQQQQNQHESHAGYNTKIFSRGGVFKKVFQLKSQVGYKTKIFGQRGGLRNKK